MMKLLSGKKIPREKHSMFENHSKKKFQTKREVQSMGSPRTTIQPKIGSPSQKGNELSTKIETHPEGRAARGW